MQENQNLQQQENMSEESFDIEDQENNELFEIQRKNLSEAIENFKQYITNKDILNKIQKEQQDHEKLFAEFLD